MENNYHKTLILDIETSGLVPQIQVPGKRPGTTKKQQLPYDTGYNDYPYIVSMAWKVDDNESEYYILNQEGREIPQEAIDIHGITDEIANESETIFAQAIISFVTAAKDCEIVVGHGLYFDTSIIKANVLRLIDEGLYKESLFDDLTEILHKYKRIDTIRSTAKMMRGWAKLQDLHMKIFHKGFTPHIAKNDVEACYRCYKRLLNEEIVPTWDKLQEKRIEKEAKIND